MVARGRFRALDEASPQTQIALVRTPIRNHRFVSADDARPVVGLDASPSYEIVRKLPSEALRNAVVIRDWLLTEAKHLRDPSAILAGLCERLNNAGVPVERAVSGIDTLHALHEAMGTFWEKDTGTTRVEPYLYDNSDDEVFRRSPFYVVYQTGKPVDLRLNETPDETFGIVPDLKAQGYTHYLCYPLFFANGDVNVLAFSTRMPDGFSELDLLQLEFALPAFTAVMEITSGAMVLDQILRTYVGDEPHREILAGSVQRGQTSRIRSAILFADMRSYTSRSSKLEPEETVALLNTYFDCLVPPIEAEGGEVLKYMGDGLLAIFRDRGDDMGGAARAALDAAQQALANLDAANAAGTFAPPVAMGIALHHGEAAYGNVGSGIRLDFTVVGRDINLASRLARLNRTLSERLLMSSSFADRLWGAPHRLGAFALDGIDGEVVVYRP